MVLNTIWINKKDKRNIEVNVVMYGYSSCHIFEHDALMMFLILFTICFEFLSDIPFARDISAEH